MEKIVLYIMDNLEEIVFKPVWCKRSLSKLFNILFKIFTRNSKIEQFKYTFTQLLA